MSIKERLESRLEAKKETDRLAKEEGDRQKEVERIERLANYQILEERRRSEKPARLEELDRRFKVLQGSGLVTLMEDFSTRKFPRIIPMTEEERQINLRKLVKKPLMLNPNIFSKQGWHLGLISPELDSLEGEWSPKDLILTMHENVYGVFNRAIDEIQETKFVTVTYNDKQNLTIAGKEITFRGHMPRLKAVRLDVFEEALAEAVFNPKVVKNEGRNQGHPFAPYHPEPRFREIIGT